MRERHEVQIAADALVVKRNRQPHRDELVSRIPIRTRRQPVPVPPVPVIR